MPERPLTPFALVLIGGVLILLVGILVLAEFLTGRVQIIDVINPTIPPIIRNNLDDLSIGLLVSIFGILVIIGAILIVTGHPANIRGGAIEALFFAIVSLLVAAGAFYIGFLLVFIGSIAALLWKPPT